MSIVSRLNLRRSVATFIFAVALCASSVLGLGAEEFLAILAGCILGGFQGAGAAGLYLTLGGLGLPVFRGATGGFSELFEEQGAMIWGCFAGALFSGLAASLPSEREKKFKLKNWLRLAVAAVIGSVSQAVLHVIFRFVGNSSQVGYNLLGASINAFAVITISTVLRPFIGKYLYPEETLTEELHILLDRK